MSISPTLGANILIVDDTVENLQLLATTLKQHGYVVRPVPSGKLALDAVESLPPDLVLLDIQMPHMNGFEVCRRLKGNAATKDIPVIFISALDATADKVEAFRSGGVDYVTKPFQFDEVIARVEAHLALSRLRQDVEEKAASLEESLGRQHELEKIKEQLVQMIVHDLKNPLTAIMGYTDCAIDSIQSGEDGIDSVEEVAEAAQSMHRMILNILDVMKLEGRELRPACAPVDLLQLAESAAGTVRQIDRRAGRVIEVKADAHLHEVLLDPDMMRRVLENLLENSVKYSPERTHIAVHLGLAPDGGIAIDISDQGPGVPEEQRSRVFEVYTRLERDEKVDARKSRGLGLAFCKMAVESHGGRIWIDDNEPQGAVFHIRLPVDPCAEGAQDEAE